MLAGLRRSSSSRSMLLEECLLTDRTVNVQLCMQVLKISQCQQFCQDAVRTKAEEAKPVAHEALIVMRERLRSSGRHDRKPVVHASEMHRGVVLLTACCPQSLSREP